MKKFKLKKGKPYMPRALADLLWKDRECSIQCYRCGSVVRGVYGSPVIERFIIAHLGHKISIREP